MREIAATQPLPRYPADCWLVDTQTLRWIQCPSCQHPLRDAVVICESDERHVVCADCHERTRQWMCPICGRDATQELIPAMPFRQLVDSLQLKCPNYSAGCPWTGSVQQADQHVASCPEQVIQCPYSTDCSRLRRKHLDYVRLDPEATN